MAQNEYLVDGADMTTVADAIREKGGTTAPLSFPAGMAAAVRNIQSGADLSLGITGAQVGQIAKITAVGTDGKPTQWEPVDMAGGGEPKQDYSVTKLSEVTIPIGEMADFEFDASIQSLLDDGYTSIVIEKYTTDNSSYSYTYYNEMARDGNSGCVFRIIPNRELNDDGTRTAIFWVSKGNSSIVRFAPVVAGVITMHAECVMLPMSMNGKAAAFTRKINVREADYGNKASGERTYRLWGERGFVK